MGNIFDLARLLRARGQEEKTLPEMMNSMDIPESSETEIEDKSLRLGRDFDIQKMSDISTRLYIIITLFIAVIATIFGVLLDRLLPASFF
ncbi:hypothetical protein FHR76_001630 [Rhizobium sp. RAS22]|nr:hypothetical protein [Rhizobium sp. RAS22]